MRDLYRLIRKPVWLRFATAASLLFLVSFVACKEKAATAVPRLKDELSSPDRATRNKAALSLASYGKDAKPAVPALIATLSDKSNGVRSSAAYALRSIGTPEAEKALEGYKK